MINYKLAVQQQFLNVMTTGKDLVVSRFDIETAFASFPLFCGDPNLNEDPVISCKKDLAGFLIYL
jgi:hypothetical protein